MKITLCNLATLILIKCISSSSSSSSSSSRTVDNLFESPSQIYT